MSPLLLWTVGTSLGAPGLRLLLRARSWRGKEIAERLPERRGVDDTARPPGRLLWLHAASVGETVSVLPVLAALAARAPDVRVLLTTGTVTSARLLAQRLPELGLEERVIHRFAPLDVPAWASRFLDHWRPNAAAFLESELWPNLLQGLQRRGIPAMLVNARLSERSFARWRRLSGLAGPLLRGFARIEAQSQADADRLRALGAPSVTVPGNLKYAAAALPAEAGELARLSVLLGDRPVWLAASTHPGEEALVFDAHRALAAAHPGLLTIIAPRHPERGERIAAQAGLLACTRRSVGQDPPVSGVWVADTLGELGLLYRLSPMAFVGRSLLPPGGGQNPLEAARLGCAVAVGPHTGNFTDIVQVLEGAGALVRLSDPAALAGWVGSMLSDPGGCAAAGRAGVAAAGRTADLPARLAATLLDLMARST